MENFPVNEESNDLKKKKSQTTAVDDNFPEN